ncbi:hypothetical protein ACI77I_26090 [Pseudomonas sp. D47]|uniref:hypothetical protein n=1 Tax=Pseudomonas sp. D47 TaxID=3159447 RepID=UPI00387ABD0D
MIDIPRPFDQGKRSMFALFNRLSGAFVLLLGRMGEEAPDIDETHFIAKPVEIDPDREMVRGTVNAFEIVAQVEQPPLIDEYTLNARCGDKVLKRYPVHRQLNILGDLLDVLVRESSLSGQAVEEFQAMRGYIEECQVRNARYKAAYSESPDFVFLDKATLEQRVLDELEGGLHEVIGSPLGTVATPFH